MLQKWAIYLLLFAIFHSKGWAQIGPPPIISVQPVGITVLNGGTAVFTVVAVSATTLSYQWYLDGDTVKKATSSILTIKKVSDDDAGRYTVKVTNASGSVTSSNAVLIIGPGSVKKNLKIDTCKMKPGGFELQLSGLTNNCVIYTSTDLINWTPIATNTPLSGNVDFIDSTATNKPACYFKSTYQ